MPCPCRYSQGHSTARLSRDSRAVALRRTAWSEHGMGMASVNQTRPHCVNQMGNTHYKPSAAQHGRGMAWARRGHGMLCVNRPLLFTITHSSKSLLVTYCLVTTFGPECGPSHGHYARTRQCTRKLYVPSGRRSPPFTKKCINTVHKVYKVTV